MGFEGKGKGEEEMEDIKGKKELGNSGEGKK